VSLITPDDISRCLSPTDVSCFTWRRFFTHHRVTVSCEYTAGLLGLQHFDNKSRHVHIKKDPVSATHPVKIQAIQTKFSRDTIRALINLANTPKMTYITMVAYPDVPDAIFDEKYYAETHLPLVFKHWAKYGLQDWKVINFEKTPDKPRTYIAMASMTWESARSFEEAMKGEEATELFDDLENFSNSKPVFLNGTVIASG